MTAETSSLKKVAVLTGLTMVIGGAEVSTAKAATTTPQAETFSISESFGSGGSRILPFQQFDSSLGTLTSVDFSLDSNISNDFGGNLPVDATIKVNGVTLSATTTAGTYDASFSGLVGAANTAFYTGSGTFGAILALTSICECTVTWDGQTSGETGLTLTYDYTPTATPLPASLPLLATGLGGLGLAAWRTRRKQKKA